MQTAPTFTNEMQTLAWIADRACANHHALEMRAAQHNKPVSATFLRVALQATRELISLKKKAVTLAKGIPATTAAPVADAPEVEPEAQAGDQPEVRAETPPIDQPETLPAFGVETQTETAETLQPNPHPKSVPLDTPQPEAEAEALEEALRHQHQRAVSRE